MASAEDPKLTVYATGRQINIGASRGHKLTVYATVQYADVQAGLPTHHGDPFDRLLVAQALLENVAVVSADTTFDLYAARRIW